MMARLQLFGNEVAKITREVGTEGILGVQAQIPDIQGIWSEITENVNFMAFELALLEQPHQQRSLMEGDKKYLGRLH